MHHRRLELHVIPEDFRVWPRPDRGAAAIRRRANPLESGDWLPALVALPIQLAVARHLHHQLRGKRIHHRQADAVQAAGGLIDLGAELAARMQRGQDYLERRAVGKFRVWVDRDATTVVAHGERTVGFETDLDPAGVAGDRLVHGVVEQFRGQMVQGMLVGAADEHAGSAADRLEALQDLDVRGGVLFRGGGTRPALDNLRHGGVICRGPGVNTRRFRYPVCLARAGSRSSRWTARMARR